MNPKKRIGDMLLEAGIIDETQLKAALGHQRQWGVRLGQALVDLKLVTERDVVRALSLKFGFEVANLAALEPYGHEQAAKLLPREFAVRHNVFPMWADTANLTVAMSDPTNLAVVDEIRFRTGRRVKVCIGGDHEIALAVKRQYPGDGGAAAIALDLEPHPAPVGDAFGGGSSDALDAMFGDASAGMDSRSAAPSPAPAAPGAPAARPPAPATQPRPAAPVPRTAASPPAQTPGPSRPVAGPSPRPAPAAAATATPTAPAAARPAAAAPAAPRPSSPQAPRPAPGPVRAPAAPAPRTPAAAPRPSQAPPSAEPSAPRSAPGVAPSAPRPAPGAAPTAPRSAPGAAAAPGPAAPRAFEIELEERPATPAAAPAVEADAVELTLFDDEPQNDAILASDLAPPDEPAGGTGASDLSPREIAILDALDRLADGAAAEAEIVKPAQAMAATIRLLIRKRIVTEKELLDELSKK